MASTTPLNEGIYMEILKRLPIKSTCRFRCVCKGWNSLISSSFFANHRLSNDSDTSFILFESLPCCASSFSFYNPDEASRLRFSPVPFEPLPARAGFWASINVDVIHGVVCLSYHRKPHHGRRFTERAVLWKPTIRKYFDVPLPPETLILGFGFDASKSEFKVVARNYRDDDSVEVFATGERRWRKVEGADKIGYCSRGYFTNGAIHWIGQEFLLMFDCECEELKAIELPRELNWPGYRILFIACYTGMVSVLAKIEHGCVLWAMEKHGVASSWKKLTREQAKGFVIINGDHVLQLDIAERLMIWNPIRLGVVKRSQQPYNGRVFKPSLFLMDGKSLA